MPTSRALPDFLIASAVSLNSLLLTKLDRLVERVVVAEAVDEEEVDVVGAHVGQPLVELAHDLAGRTREVLGDDEDLLADVGLLLEPLAEVGLGLVCLGGVEAADALGVRVPEDPLESPAPARPRVEDGDVDSGLAQRPPGDRQRLRGLVGEGMAPGPEAGGRNRGRGDGPCLEERAAIGACDGSWDMESVLSTGLRKGSGPDAGQRPAIRADGPIGHQLKHWHASRIVTLREPGGKAMWVGRSGFNRRPARCGARRRPPRRGPSALAARP